MKITKELITESGDKITLNYTVTQGADGWYGIHIYNTITNESADADSLSPYIDEITELLKTVSQCSVTPITLRDIVYDWLCNKYIS